MNCRYMIFYDDTKIGVIEIEKVKKLEEDKPLHVTDLNFRINNLNSHVDLNDNQEKDKTLQEIATL